LAIAVVAALGVFAAVVTGWAARGSAVAGVALPQLAAQSQQAHAAQPAEHAPVSLHRDAPVDEKVTTNAWMTRERPPTWPRLTPDAVWSPLPPSLAASGVPPDNVASVPPTPALAGRDLLTHLCVTRV
jgi:hypothetical protein